MTQASTATSPRPITLWLAKVAGARPEVLAKAPAGSGKQAAMGGVILTTSVLAAVSATFALHIALGVPVWLAALFGLGWGVVILNLDRMLVLGMGHEQSWKRNLAMAVPRVVLACILGIVISTPLTLQIFNKEISVQLLVQQQENLKSYDAQLKGLTDSINATQARVQRDQATQAGGGIVDPAADPRVVAAQQDVAAKQSAYNAASNEYDRLAALAQCEFNGTCGTGKVGDGPQYRSALALANNQKRIADSAHRELTTSQQTLASAQLAARKSATQNTATNVSNAKADEAQATQKLQNLNAQKTAFQKTFVSANSKDTGLLARLQALDTLASKNSTMRTAQLMLAALFLCIEILPVLMKLLMNIGSKTAYETVALGMDAEDVHAYEQERQRLQDEHDNLRRINLNRLKAESDAAVETHSLIVDNERDRVTGQRKLLEEINARVSEEQKKVVLDALEIWSRHAVRESARVLEEYERSVNNSYAQTQPTVEPAGWTPPQDPQPTTFGPTRIVNGTNGVHNNGRDNDSIFTTKVGLPPEDEV